MEVYAPLAHRLGMQRVKVELEDLSLQYLDPVGYAGDRKRTWRAQQAERESFLEEIKEQHSRARVGRRSPMSHLTGVSSSIYGIYQQDV